MTLNIKRTHDKAIYLKENRYEQPKEYFKRLAALVRAGRVDTNNCAACDIGCAAGEFLHFFSREFPGAHCVGYDAVPELLEKARRVVPNAEFRLGSVLDRGMAAPHSFDVCFLLGVHSIFDEIETLFSNLLSWTKPGGTLYVFGMFNRHPVDVWVKYRRVDDPDPDHREPGWNVFSKATVSDLLDRRGLAGKYYFEPFELPFDLPPNPDDPIRSWTFRDGEGRRLFCNGLSLLINLEFLVINP